MISQRRARGRRIYSSTSSTALARISPLAGEKCSTRPWNEVCGLHEQRPTLLPPLLAQRPGDVIVGPAVIRLSRPARDQHFRRAGFRRVGRQALALLEAFCLAEPVGAGLAVG